MVIIRHTTVGRTPLDEWSNRRESRIPDISQRSQETDIHAPPGFEHEIPASDRPQTPALESAATGTGMKLFLSRAIYLMPLLCTLKKTQLNIFNYHFHIRHTAHGTRPVAARSKAWVCGRSPDGIVGSNPAGSMDVCLLWVLCVVR